MHWQQVIADEDPDWIEYEMWFDYDCIQLSLWWSPSTEIWSVAKRYRDKSKGAVMSRHVNNLKATNLEDAKKEAWDWSMTIQDPRPAPVLTIVK